MSLGSNFNVNGEMNLDIKDLRDGMKRVSVEGRVVEKGNTR